MQPPIFIAFANGEVLAFATQKEVETWFCMYEDVEPATSRAWDSRGLMLEFSSPPEGVGIVLTPSDRPPQPETLRDLLAAALERIEPGAPHDGPLDELVAIAADRFRTQSSFWPCAIVLVPLLVAGAVVGYLLLRR